MSALKNSKTIEFARSTIVFIGLILVVFCFRVFLFEPFNITSGSMRPNIMVGDYVMTSKYPYGQSRYSVPFWPDVFKGRIFPQQPERGDIIVFAQNGQRFIKRLIGLPGDVIGFKEDTVYLNGQQLKRKSVATESRWDAYNLGKRGQFMEFLPSGRSYVILDQGGLYMGEAHRKFIVPEGYYFFLGDNRDNSLDSRVKTQAGGTGMVPFENLIGRAEFIMLSAKGDPPVWRLGSWLASLRMERFFHILK